MARRKKFQREKDLLLISERYLRGVPQAIIAEEIGYTQQTVSNDLKELQRRWLDASIQNLDEAKSRELAKVDNLEREYWDAWVRSQQDAETVIKERQGKDGDAKAKVQKKTVGQTGDASFLRGVEWCINKRCELLGLDAPEKVEQSGKVQIEVIYDSSPDTPEAT